MSRDIFIKDDVPREEILPSQVTNAPADVVFFIAYKYCFITAGTAFCPELGRDRREALAPPDTKV